MLKQTAIAKKEHKIRNHLTIIQTEVLLTTPKTLELTKKIVSHEIKTIKSLMGGS